MKARRHGWGWFGLAALLACGCSESGASQASPGSATPSSGRRGFFARDLRTGVTMPDGSRQEVRIDRVRLVAGRFAGLRAPLLDALAFEGIQLRENGVETLRAPDVRVGSYGLVTAHPAGVPLPPELRRLVERLSGLAPASPQAPIGPAGTSPAAPGSAGR